VLLILGFSILLNQLESVLKTKLRIASLLGVMAIGFILTEYLPDTGKNFLINLIRWVFAEILLFVLVGAEVNVNVALKAGGIGIILILTGLIGRSVGVAISLLGTDLIGKKGCFVLCLYPKATVQAAMVQCRCHWEWNQET